MLVLLNIVFQFVLHANDPHWACALTHRDLHATFLLYCTQTLPGDIEIISVGRYIPDAPLAAKIP